VDFLHPRFAVHYDRFAGPGRGSEIALGERNSMVNSDAAHQVIIRLIRSVGRAFFAAGTSS